MGLFGFFKLSLSCFSGHVGRVVSDFSFGESSGYLFLGGGGRLDDKMIREMGRDGKRQR